MIERFGSWILVHGASCSVAAAPTKRYVVGAGVSDIIDACIEAFHFGHNVGFIREVPKAHGLLLSEEGAHRHMSEAIKERRSLNVEQSVVRRAEITNSLGRLRAAKYKQVPDDLSLLFDSVKRDVLIHSGQFHLSGGGHSSTYVDTIPAATSFETLCAIAQISQGMLQNPSLLIAPPYGGISLGVFLAMYWEIDVAIPVRSDEPCRELVSAIGRLSHDTNIVLVDDYYSTGSTASRLLEGCDHKYELLSVCRSPIVNESVPIKALLVNRCGVIEWAEEAQHMLNLGSVGEARAI